MKIFCSNIGLHRSLFLSLSFFPPQTLNKPKYSIVTVQSFKAVHQRMGLKKTARHSYLTSHSKIAIRTVLWTYIMRNAVEHSPAERAFKCSFQNINISEKIQADGFLNSST